LVGVKLLEVPEKKPLSRETRKAQRSFLSPLRLPVPPSRLYLQVLEFTTCSWLCSLFIGNDECATV
jgi:hypothetical protein